MAMETIEVDGETRLKLPEVRLSGNNWGDAAVEFGQYIEGGALSIRLLTYDVEESGGWELLTTVTVNLVHYPLRPDRVLVKSWGENEGIVGLLASLGWATPTGMEVMTGYVKATEMQMEGDLLTAAREWLASDRRVSL